MEKQTGYKYQIEHKLLELDYEIIEINSSNNWWNDEYWLVRYNYDSKTKFYVYFIVDPHFEGNRKKGQGVYQIIASTELLKNWNDSDNLISSIEMSKRYFDSKLIEFGNDLENFRMK